jgi:hypothetical protein
MRAGYVKSPSAGIGHKYDFRVFLLHSRSAVRMGGDLFYEPGVFPRKIVLNVYD